MTKSGVKFIIFFAALVLFGVSSGIREVFFLVFICGIILVFALISAVFGLLTLGPRQTTATPSVVRNSSAMCVFSLKGFTPLPVITIIKVRDFFGEEKSYAGVSFFHKHTAFNLELFCPHRGRWKAGIVETKFSDMFGLFRFKTTKRNSKPSEMVVSVFPILFPFSREPLPKSLSIDDKHFNPIVSDVGDTFSDTRLYRDGDSLKRIHWKMSVRTRELYTRQFETSAEQDIFILIDTYPSEPSNFSSELAFDDIASEAALVLMQYYQNQGKAVHLIPAGLREYSITAVSSESVTAAYEMLSFLNLRSETSLAAELSSMRNEIPLSSEIILFSRAYNNLTTQSLLPILSQKNKITLLYTPSIHINSAAEPVFLTNFKAVPIFDAENIIEQIRRYSL